MNTPAEPLSLALQHQQAGQWPQAEALFRQVLAAEPGNADAHHGLGVALFAQDKLTDAAYSFRRAIYFRHDFTEAIYNLARVCYAQNDWADAARLLEQSLKRTEPDFHVLDALARLFHYQLGKRDKALHYYQKCLELDPSSADIRFRMEGLRGVSTEARMPAEVVAGAYDADAERWDRTVREQGYESPRLLMAALEPAPASPKSLDVLDLGCGTGLCGLCFQSWARSLTGIDLSPKMLDQARARGIYEALIQGDIITAPRQFVNRFDLVVASDVLLLLGDLAALFESVHEATRHGGRFAFTVDLHAGPEDYRLTPWSIFAHSRSYLHKRAAECGWQIVSMTDVMFPRENRSQVAGLVVVLAKACEPQAPVLKLRISGNSACVDMEKK
jgi:predicted TPR repeat methyltransferase